MEYEVSLQTIAWIHARRNDESLEISPAFQRRAVWMERERSELMATIVSGLPFPEIYIHVVTDPDSGKQRHIVVDGQQRTTSILMFIDNDVALPQTAPFKGEYFRDLSDRQKESFWDYKVVVRSLRKTNEAEIRDIFSRLNTNNVTLNDQELRNARYVGRFKQAAERFADNPLFEKMGLFTARDMRRMLDVEFVSELLVRQIAGITNKKDLLEDAYAACEEEFPDEAQYETEFTTAMSLIWSIYDEENPSPLKTRGNFYSIFGCFVDFTKRTNKKSFDNPGEVKKLLSNFLAKVKTRQFDEPEIEEYQDAVSRASSDRARRARREEILWGLLQKAGEC
ncbi:hypothetical protein NS383_07260 [Pseudomonas oryzihabitans]|nr:hypothetical protein NS383_07260 [Pseudomonas psychrotolerans]